MDFYTFLTTLPFEYLSDAVVVWRMSETHPVRRYYHNAFMMGDKWDGEMYAYDYPALPE